MDAGLIGAAPVADAVLPMRSVNAQAAAASQGQGANAAQNDGTQSSFADVLQQSSDAQSDAPSNTYSNGQSADQSSKAPADPSNGSGAGAFVDKNASGNDNAASSPTIGGQVLVGPGAGMVATPIVPVAAPVLLQTESDGKQGVKSPIASISHKSSETGPAKNDMRKPMTIDAQGQEVPVTATPAMTPQAPMDVSQILKLSPGQDTGAAVVSGAKGSSQAGVDGAASAKSSGTATKSIRDAVLHAASGDTAGVADAASASASSAPDAAASPVAAHSDPAALASTHGAVAVDLVTSAVGSAGAGAVGVVPVFHAVAQTQTLLPSAADQSSSPHTGISSTDSTSVSGADHTTLVATPNVLEVGLSSGTHGWLRVRAEMSTDGDVSASVRAASETAYDALHKDLPSMSAYLASERVGVTSLVVEHTPASSGSGANPGASNMANTDSGSQGAQAGSQGGAAPGSAWNTGGVDAQVGDDAQSGLSVSDAALSSGAALPVAAYANRSGGWLSVLA